MLEEQPVPVRRLRASHQPNKYINAQIGFSICTDSSRAASPNWVKRKAIEAAGAAMQPTAQTSIPSSRSAPVHLRQSGGLSE
jgi:hypothetical protein